MKLIVSSHGNTISNSFFVVQENINIYIVTKGTCLLYSPSGPYPDDVTAYSYKFGPYSICPNINFDLALLAIPNKIDKGKRFKENTNLYDIVSFILKEYKGVPIDLYSHSCTIPEDYKDINDNFKLLNDTFCGSVLEETKVYKKSVSYRPKEKEYGILTSYDSKNSLGVYRIGSNVYLTDEAISKEQLYKDFYPSSINQLKDSDTNIWIFSDVGSTFKPLTRIKKEGMIYLGTSVMPFDILNILANMNMKELGEYYSEFGLPIIFNPMTLLSSTLVCRFMIYHVCYKNRELVGNKGTFECLSRRGHVVFPDEIEIIKLIKNLFDLDIKQLEELKNCCSILSNVVERNF